MRPVESWPYWDLPRPLSFRCGVHSSEHRTDSGLCHLVRLSGRCARSLLLLGFARWATPPRESRAPGMVRAEARSPLGAHDIALPVPSRSDRHGGHSRGFDVHAGVVVTASDREGRERLLRYCARPPLSLERLSVLRDGRIAYAIRKPWTSETHRVMQPCSSWHGLPPSSHRHATRSSLSTASLRRTRPGERRSCRRAPHATANARGPVDRLRLHRLRRLRARRRPFKLTPSRNLGQGLRRSSSCKTVLDGLSASTPRHHHPGFLSMSESAANRR